MRVPKEIYGQIVSAKCFIDGHFNEAISLARVAAQAHMSAFHFHRMFTKVYRITPHQYITKKRLLLAKELLKTGNGNISGVCTDIGFESHGSFSSLFKKHHGLSPQVFRRHALQTQLQANINPRVVIPGCFLPANQ